MEYLTHPTRTVLYSADGPGGLMEKNTWNAITAISAAIAAMFTVVMAWSQHLHISEPLEPHL